MASGYPRVLLISALSRTGFNIAPPIGLYQLQHYVQERGIDCDLLDRELIQVDQHLAEVEAGGFDVIGVSVTRFNMQEDLLLIHQFKQAALRAAKPVIFIVGGQESAQNHQQWLDFGIDAVLLGFAEKILLEFCQRLRALPSGTPVDFEAHFADMAGIAFKRPDGSYRFNPAPMFNEEEFREFFYHQRKTINIPFEKYWDRLRTEISDYSVAAAEFYIENIRMYTSSHCPRGCGFCNSQSFLPIAFGAPAPILMLSADEVLDLVQMHSDRMVVHSYLFSDDDFPIGNKVGLDRLRAFCRGIIERKRAGRIPAHVKFSCQARVMDFVARLGTGGERAPDLPLIQLMAEAGFMSIGLGVETFIDRMLKVPSVTKGAVTTKDAVSVLDAMLAAGLHPQTNLMLGLPEYTPEELSENMDIGMSYILRGCDVAVTSHLLAVPGAPIWNKGLYALHSDRMINPLTGKTELNPMYYIPNHPQVAAAVEGYGQAHNDEINRVVERMGWQGKTLHRRIIGVCGLIAMARGLNNLEQAARFRQMLDGILDKAHPVAA